MSPNRKSRSHNKRDSRCHRKRRRSYSDNSSHSSRHRHSSSNSDYSRRSRRSKQTRSSSKYSRSRRDRRSRLRATHVYDSNVQRNTNCNRSDQSLQRVREADRGNTPPTSQYPSTSGQQWFSGITANFNVVPEFDPSDDSQNIEWWIHKINECVKIYNWDDRQTCHYALPKLVGLAKKWYQGLPSLLFTWEEWKITLKAAFPSNENYGDLLTKMLKVRCIFGQSFDNYYYEKLALLNKCEITGSKAVGCLIQGLDDKFVRMSASACMFNEPEKLLSYLRTITVSEWQTQKSKFQNTNLSQYTYKNLVSLNAGTEKELESVRCFNCKEFGHLSSKCSSN